MGMADRDASGRKGGWASSDSEPRNARKPRSDSARPSRPRNPRVRSAPGGWRALVGIVSFIAAGVFADSLGWDAKAALISAALAAVVGAILYKWVIGVAVLAAAGWVLVNLQRGDSPRQREAAGAGGAAAPRVVETPSDPTPSVGDSVRPAVADAPARGVGACISNPTPYELEYDYRWGETGWQSATVPPSLVRWHTWALETSDSTAPDFFIRFDNEFYDGYSETSYRLLTSATALPTTCEGVRKFEFAVTLGSIDLVDPTVPVPETMPFVIGVTLADIESFFYQGTEYTGGTRVVSAAPTGPAAQAGLEADDVIYQAEETRITSFRALNDFVNQGGGAPIRLFFVRGPNLLTTVVTPVADRRNLPRGRYSIGIVVRDVGPISASGRTFANGAELVSVYSGLPAAAAELRIGDILLTVDDQSIDGIDALVQGLQSPGKPVLIRFARNGQLLERTLVPILIP